MNDGTHSTRLICGELGEGAITWRGRDMLIIDYTTSQAVTSEVGKTPAQSEPTPQHLASQPITRNDLLRSLHARSSDKISQYQRPRDNRPSERRPR